MDQEELYNKIRTVQNELIETFSKKFDLDTMCEDDTLVFTLAMSGLAMKISMLAGIPYERMIELVSIHYNVDASVEMDPPDEEVPDPTLEN